MTRIYYVRHAEPNYDNHDDRMRELTDKGLWERRLVTAFAQKQWHDFSFRLADGECLQAVQDRNIRALHQVIQRYSGKIS